MKISLGTSDEVKPLFEIKSEKRIISFTIFITKYVVTRMRSK